MDKADKAALGVLGATVALLVVGIVYVVGAETTKKSCLEAGFPKSSMTITFESYCIDLDGAVVVRVEEVQGD
jgi:hypothetical protein